MDKRDYSFYYILMIIGIVVAVHFDLKAIHNQLKEISEQSVIYEEYLNSITNKIPSEISVEIKQSEINSDDLDDEDSEPLPDEEDCEIAEELNENENTSYNYWGFKVGQLCPLPNDIPTNTYRCMDYRTITNKKSEQYYLQQQCYTNLYNGIRCYQSDEKVYYCAALAGAYGVEIGSAYKIILENDISFNVILAEYKHDISDPKPDDYGDNDVNYDREDCINVIEFVYDSDTAPLRLINDGEANRFLGDGCDIYGHSCNIKTITYLGRVWENV